MGRPLKFRLLAGAALLVFVLAGYMDQKTGESVYFIIAGLALFSSMLIGLLMTTSSK